MLDFLLPQRCAGCARPGAHVCAGCNASLQRIVAPLCARCGAQTAWPVERCRECAGRRLAFATARSAVVYDDVVRGIVAAWKERGLRHIAAWAADQVVANVPRPTPEVLVAVPPDRDRLLTRGHHPAASLARELASRWQLEHRTLLRRTRGTSKQRGLGHVARRRNVRGVFVAPTPLRGAVLVVDDVYTTGATANAAASALRRAGATRVEVLTFARTRRIG